MNCIIFLTGHQLANEQPLPLKCTSLCTLAFTAISSIIDQAVDGTIQCETIQAIQRRKEQFQKLCAVCQDPGDEKDMESIINQRIGQMTAFRRYTSNFSKLCLEIERLDVKVEGIRVWYPRVTMCMHCMVW